MFQYYHPDDYNCLHCYLVKGRLMESLVPGVEGVKVKPLVVDCDCEIYASPSADACCVQGERGESSVMCWDCMRSYSTQQLQRDFLLNIYNLYWA